MKLYLNKKLESIFVLKEVDTLLRDLLDNPEYNSILTNIDSIETVQHIIDPVQDFIDYYEKDSNVKLGEERKQYIKNALYSAKGAPEVFKVFELCFEVHIDYTYNFPVVEVVDIYVLKISDVILFTNKFKTLIYHLLYYTELYLYIKNLILNLTGDLVNNSSVAVKGYTEVITEWDGEVF